MECGEKKKGEGRVQFITNKRYKSEGMLDKKKAAKLKCGDRKRKSYQ